MEEKSNKIIELDCKIRSQSNEINNLRANVEELKACIVELKDQNCKLESKFIDFKKRFFEQIISKEETICEYREKLELIQTKMLETNLNRNSSNLFGSITVNQTCDFLEIVNDNIYEINKDI